MHLAVLALGSNLGKREDFINSACVEISKIGQILAKSKIYETPAQGYENQGDFLNAVIAISTELAPTELLLKCQQIELGQGRVRSFKDAPRTLDIDIIFFDDSIIESESLTVPHPRWHERDFVITPLLDLSESGVFDDKKFEKLRLFLSQKKREFKPVKIL